MLTVKGLARLIERMQRRAAEFPDEVPPGATAWVQYGPSHTEADVQALQDQGYPYGLVLAYRRVPTDPEEDGNAAEPNHSTARITDRREGS